MASGVLDEIIWSSELQANDRMVREFSHSVTEQGQDPKDHT